MLKHFVSRLRGERSNHPLGTADNLAAVVADLTGKRPTHALMALRGWLADAGPLVGQLPRDACQRAILRLDEAAQPWLAALWDDAARQLHTLDPQAEITLKALESYYHTAARALEVALNLQEALSPQQPKALTVILARMLRALSREKLAARICFQDLPGEWWPAAHALMEKARALGALHLREILYPGDSGDTSPWREYRIGLFYELGPLGNLSPRQMILLDRIVAWAEPHFTLADTPAAGTPWRLRTDGLRGPERMIESPTAEQTAEPGWRYLGPGRVSMLLFPLKSDVVRQQTVPDWLSIPPENDREAAALLQRLMQHWSQTPPKRRHARKDAQSALRVVPGFDLARRMVAAGEYARSGRQLEYAAASQQAMRQAFALPTPTGETLTAEEVLASLETAGDRQMMERWELRDISMSGLGARPPVKRQWQAIGALVGLRTDQSLHWRLALVRRLTRSHGRYNAGLALLPGEPRCALLEAIKRPDDPWAAETGGLRGTVDALQVDDKAGHLLAPLGTFGPGGLRYTLVSGGTRQPVVLQHLLESGPDYELIAYTVGAEGSDPAAPATSAA